MFSCVEGAEAGVLSGELVVNVDNPCPFLVSLGVSQTLHANLATCVCSEGLQAFTPLALPKL